MVEDVLVLMNKVLVIGLLNVVLILVVVEDVLVHHKIGDKNMKANTS